ncbi:MAG: lamin tail domain-containing protein, partial [Planctomycetes bacterium]|nr:lamin tail domain-containing protein [Planctomycetota bacterium]
MAPPLPVKHLGLMAVFVSLLASVPPLAARILVVEIQYHPAGSRPEQESLEFVELYNDEPLPFDLSGYRLTDGLEYSFPAGTVVQGESVVVAARNPDALAAAHGVERPFGPYAGSLDNGGDAVALIDAGGSTVCRVRYDDRGRWPAAADGAGPSLVLKDPLLPPGEGESWGWSPKRGGTPGEVSFDTVAPEVLLNEIYRDGQGSGWIELFNPSLQTAADLSGYQLAGDPDFARRFVLPVGSVIAPHGFLTVGEAALGFPLEARDQWFALANPGGERVADAVRLEAAVEGTVDGRHPDGAPRWHRLSPATPAGANRLSPAPPIAISEIHYHPYSENDADEFLELANTGNQTVHLDGFAFTAGIQFTFPAGSALAPGEYLVVAKDPARIEAAYGLSGVHGPYEGVLADGGELIRLRDALGNPVDEVRYRDDGSWPRWADGAGPSLELVDLRQDNAAGAAWLESDHAASSAWNEYEYTGRQKSGDSELHLYLLGAGEALLDDLEVVPRVGGNNLIPDGNFDGPNPLGKWVIEGTHIDSFLEAGAGSEGTNALHLVASRRGDSGANRLERQTAPSMTPGAEYTVRFKARWLKGSDLLMTRSWNHGLARVTRLAVPPLGGTPGRANSRALASTGPLIQAVEQNPPLPKAGEEVAVTAQVSDPGGVAAAAIHYRLDKEADFKEAPLSDDGLAPDRLAGDGVYAAAIAGMGTPRAVAEFYISAKDGQGLERTAPPAAPKETFIYQYDDGLAPHAVPAYRVVLREQELRALQARSPLSNHHLPAALVYRRERIFNSAALRYRGSPFLRDPGVTGLRKGLRVRLSEENSLRSLVRITLDEQEVDPSAQVDRLVRHFLQKAGGIPYGERRHVHLIFRGASLGTYEEVLTVDPHYLERSFTAGGAGGELYKIDAHYEIQDNGVDFPFPEFTSWKYTAEKEDLRFTYKKRSRIKEDDYSALMELLDLMDLSRSSAEAFDLRAPALLDLDSWIKAIAVYRAADDWDAVGGWTGKNDYLYRHPDGRWRLIPWDHDVAFGSAALQADQNPQAYLYTPYFPEIRRLLQRPALDRKFNAELLRLLREDYDRAAVDPALDEVYGLLKRTSGAAPPSKIKSFLSARRSFLLTKVADVPRFLIETNAGAPFEAPSSPAVLRGQAPYAVESIFLESEPLPVRWIDRQTWEVKIPLRRGENPITLAALDGSGEVVGSASIEVTYAPPPDRFLRGDANDDLRLSISDAIRTILHLFAGQALLCGDAADADDSGTVEVSDPLFILKYLFLGGSPPPPPFPDPGPDPTADVIPC